MCRMLPGAMLTVLAGSPGVAAAGGGLKASLFLDADSYALGQPTLFVVTLENNGGRSIRAHLPRRDFDDFHLEMAFGDGACQEVEFRQLASLGTRARLRDFKPGEVIGDSKVLLLKGWRDKPPERLAQEDEADLSRWLICGRPGKYRLRAKLRVDLGKESLRPESSEVRFEVKPPGKGYRQFVKFAIAHIGFGEHVSLSRDGYKAARGVLEDLKGTVYRRYLYRAMMSHFRQTERMNDEELPEDFTAEEKAQRGDYRGFAERLLAGATPRERRSGLGEEALAYLVLYYIQEGDLAKSLEYAKAIRREMPWSRYAEAADMLEEELERRRPAKTKPATRPAAMRGAPRRGRWPSAPAG
ncbi:MAG: hypothetical protein AMJ81_02130 [Phycisphaerae bacterium SM23_33]|nr:MAG: hypothetical protein AMJ81_02130 [Phycisphaerae bacterium SM23_33]